jgi:hypothetical protein
VPSKRRKREEVDIEGFPNREELLKTLLAEQKKVERFQDEMVRTKKEFEDTLKAEREKAQKEVTLRSVIEKR